MEIDRIDLEVLQEIYLEEAWKQVDRIDDFLEKKLKQKPCIEIDRNELNSIYRLLHSAKGSASMMGFASIAETAHHAEDLFVYLLEKQTPTQKELMTILQLLKMVSRYIKGTLRRIESKEEIIDFGWWVIKRIKNFLEHIESEEVVESPTENVLYTRKGKKVIPFMDFKTLLPQMRRLITLMSRELEKEVELQIEGIETEVPRDIFEKISTAVLQMIKNSMDHGIESKEKRISLGKPAKGKIIIEISKNMEKVFVQFRDDGQGLDKDRILEEAKQRGVLRKEPDQYTDSEVYHFLLRPGFTTKSCATLFSGRGMGLDVVNAGISALGGKLCIDSKRNVGTAFFMEFPLKG